MFYHTGRSGLVLEEGGEDWMLQTKDVVMTKRGQALYKGGKFS